MIYEQNILWQKQKKPAFETFVKKILVYIVTMVIT